MIKLKKNFKLAFILTTISYYIPELNIGSITALLDVQS